MLLTIRGRMVTWRRITSRRAAKEEKAAKAATAPSGEVTSITTGQPVCVTPASAIVASIEW